MAGEDVSEENHLVCFLASFLESYNALVTTLKVKEDAPNFEVITEHVLH